MKALYKSTSTATSKAAGIRLEKSNPNGVRALPVIVIINIMEESDI